MGEFCLWIYMDRYPLHATAERRAQFYAALAGHALSAQGPGLQFSEFIGVFGAGNAESFQAKGRARSADLAGSNGMWQPGKTQSTRLPGL